jgi:hypothetical protein
LSSRVDIYPACVPHNGKEKGAIVKWGFKNTPKLYDELDETLKAAADAGCLKSLESLASSVPLNSPQIARIACPTTMRPVPYQ